MSNNTTQEEREKKLEALIRHNFNRAFVDAVRVRLENNDWDYFLLLLSEMKQNLYSLVPNRVDLHHKLNDAVPEDLIAQMIKHNAIKPNDFRGYFSAVVTWLEPLCDEEEGKRARTLLSKLGKMEILNYAEVIPPVILEINEIVRCLQEARQKFLDKVPELEKELGIKGN